MHVTFHGVRGSVPTPGPSTVRYGGNTVCVEVRLGDGTLIVLDAGTGIRELGNRLLRENHAAPIHLLITHPHWDHIIGLPFFAPLYRKDTRIVLHPMTPGALVRTRNPILFDGEHFPVRFADLPARIERDETAGPATRIGSARVTTIALNHPGGATGYRIDDADGASVCYLTDNELRPPAAPATSTEELARFASGTGILIHDAQYIPSDMPGKHGWGHSIVEDVLGLARDAEARTIILHHHDPDRDDDALDKIAGDAVRWAGEHAPSMKTAVAREGMKLSP